MNGGRERLPPSPVARRTLARRMATHPSPDGRRDHRVFCCDDDVATKRGYTRRRRRSRSPCATIGFSIAAISSCTRTMPMKVFQAPSGSARRRRALALRTLTCREGHRTRHRSRSGRSPDACFSTQVGQDLAEVPVEIRPPGTPVVGNNSDRRHLTVRSIRCRIRTPCACSPFGSLVSKRRRTCQRPPPSA